ncbi:effector binding domain-containing protein [Parapedobacter sp. ISTM3]|uniref:Predicted transcriptional regulator YdeE, contains AraC-type DNA-binding domain n=1 Tax=Parapedobacter luteus TaxID=623280 RepID=A0A1T5BB13_9SPHI|nr:MULTISPECIES: GyrI-like domain-containing protein [Parapedobacter]MBK1439636.1 effector binding domain-containing protein [Parapedobacter sp. ISTM3]SKB44436.1 Predicted transcriptional regulator YdeE, contains AraC-type DNA-binding domain [Parapedobacter luteus]
MAEKKDAFKLVGLRLNGKTTNQNNQSSKDCGNLWQKFEADKVFDLIPEKLSNEVFAVYFDYEKDETAPFSYFIGCKVPDHVATPNGLEVLVIPSQTYTKFTARGKMTACITDTWKGIWNSDIKRKFAFDFEVYDERSQNWDNAEVDIYISIK